MSTKLSPAMKCPITSFNITQYTRKKKVKNPDYVKCKC